MSKNFSKEFKEHAVGLVEEGQSKSFVARNLDIGKSTLDRWVRLKRLNSPAVLTLKSSSESEELKRLRKEINILQKEREILKKAAAFFAKEQL
jgi:transposase